MSHLSVNITNTGPVTIHIGSPAATPAAASSSVTDAAKAALASSSSSSSAVTTKQTKPLKAEHRATRPKEKTEASTATLSAALFAKFYPVGTAVQGKLPRKSMHPCTIQGAVLSNGLIKISGAEKMLGENIPLNFLSNPLKVDDQILIWDSKKKQGHYLATIQKIAGPHLTVNYDDFGKLEQTVAPSRMQGCSLYNWILVQDPSILPSLPSREITSTQYDVITGERLPDATGKIYDLSTE